MSKAALALLTDKRTWTVIGSIVAALLLPFILLIVVLCSMLSATANHNNAAVDLCFNGGPIPASMPAEYREYILDMRACFESLDSAIAEVESQMEDGSLDDIRVKAVFYALFFGSENLRLEAERARAFVDCFVTYETRAAPDDEDADSDDEEDQEEEAVEVAVPIEDLTEIYRNVSTLIGRPITPEDQANITEIWLRVKYQNFDPGADMPLEGGNGTHDLIGELADPDRPLEPGETGSPLAGGWRDKVTSEFGYRKNPTGPGYDGHTGLDMGVPLGTSVHAIKGGTVLFVRYKQTGYGYHVAIDHGGGFVTMYAHCSEILVTEGQRVEAGDVIARSGSTGNSTGPHLHLETIQDGVPQNPRKYLN